MDNPQNNTNPANPGIQQPQQDVYEGAKRTGSGFTNLQTILNANKNNQLGSTLASGITQSGQQAKNNLTQAQGQFQSGLDTQNQNTQNYKAQGQDIYNRTMNDPSSVTDDDTSKFVNIGKQTYGGPSGLQNASAIQAQTQNAQDQGNLVDNRNGRVELLRRFANQGSNNQYTSNMQNLDELYLGGSQDQLRQARQTTQGLGDQAQNTANVDLQQANAAKSNLTGVQQDLYNNADTADNSLFNTLQQNAQTESQNLQNKYNALINSGYNQNLINQVTGTNSYNADNLYGASPLNSAFISAAQNPTISNIATDQQRAQATALEKMLGRDPSSKIDTSAAAYNPNDYYNFNNQAFQGALGQAKSSYDQSVSPINQKINDYNAALVMKPFTDQFGRTFSVDKNAVNQQLAAQYAALNAIRSQRGMSQVQDFQNSEQVAGQKIPGIRF